MLMFARFQRIFIIMFWAVGVTALILLNVSAVAATVSAGAVGPAVVLVGLQMIFGFILLSIVGGEMIALRERRARMMLEIVEQAVRLNLPLPGVLEAAAKSEGKPLGRMLASLSDNLRRGTPLAVALDMSGPELPPRTLATIRAAEQLGMLRPLLPTILRRHQSPSAATPFRVQWLYAVMVLFAVLIATAFYAVFIHAKMVKIFEDYDLTLDTWRTDIMRLLTALVPLGAVLLIGACLWWAWRVFWPRGYANSLPQRAMAALAMAMPLSRRMLYHQGLSDLCLLMSEAVATGLPPHQALEESADGIVHPRLYRRVLAWSRTMAGGASLHEAARAAGMPELLCGLLATVRGRDDTRQAFAFLGRYHSTRLHRLLVLAAALIELAIILLLGLLVLWVMLLTFRPLVQLIEAGVKMAELAI